MSQNVIKQYASFQKSVRLLDIWDALVKLVQIFESQNFGWSLWSYGTIEKIFRNPFEARNREFQADSVDYWEFLTTDLVKEIRNKN